jgi:preprotein translocase subunit SecD
MFKKTNIRFIIIAVALVLAGYSLYWTVAFHSYSPEKIEALREAGKIDKYEERIIRLGLDLQGGMHVILELNLPKLVEKSATNKTPEFYEILNAATEEFKSTDGDFFDIYLRRVDEQDFKLVRYFPNRGYKNSEIVNSLRDETKDAMTRSVEIITNRVDQFGVSEPTIQRAGQYRIIVELAGVQDSERARKLIQNPAVLEFYLLKDPTVTQSFIAQIDNYLKTGQKEQVEKTAEEAPADSTVALKESKDKAVSVTDLLGVSESRVDVSADTADTMLLVDEELFSERPFSSLLRNVGSRIGVPARNVYAVKKILADPEVMKLTPYDSKFLWSANPERLTMQDGTTENYHLLYHVNREASMQGRYITKAVATIGTSGSQSAGQPIVNLNMNNEGAKIWSRLTGSNIDKYLAIVLDEKVYIAPLIKVKIANGATVVEGLESMEEAKDIAIVLRAGALPADLDVIEERTIGPSLGRDSINTSTRILIIGFVLVVGFMFMYYKGAGLLADMAVLLNIVFVMAILATLRATLTLPGIAGLILTVGMAVDANVLIFERIRDELAKGKTVRAAIDSGYGRAFRTILDANVTTMLTALILMQFGTGPVKGFAITLFWGILSSMFTAIFVTRTIYNYRTEHKTLQKLSI